MLDILVRFNTLFSLLKIPVISNSLLIIVDNFLDVLPSRLWVMFSGSVSSSLLPSIYKAKYFIYLTGNAWWKYVASFFAYTITLHVILAHIRDIHGRNLMFFILSGS